MLPNLFPHISSRNTWRWIDVVREILVYFYKKMWCYTGELSDKWSTISPVFSYLVAELDELSQLEHFSNLIEIKYSN